MLSADRRERIARGVGTLTYADQARLIFQLFIHEKKSRLIQAAHGIG